ncbi:MAG TPA: hypothetical protein VFK56_10865 [Mycobacterium sp.]|nr:hypothetical protein [Mycobacterium sp.]
MTVDELIDFHRAAFGGFRMEAGDGDGGDGGSGDGGEQEQTFTQADVDRIVRERVKREREKFADYDDLKAKAGEAATAEERIAALEKEIQATQREALRRRVQAAHGISDEDADLFLTGTDEETLTAQAKRLADRESERKSNGNHVPREGNNPQPTDDPMRSFARGLFDRANAD